MHHEDEPRGDGIPSIGPARRTDRRSVRRVGADRGGREGLITLLLMMATAGVPVRAAPLEPPPPESTTRPPNIVVILADDLGVGDLAHGAPDARIPTPHMDRLAREGIRFDDAHAPAAVCTPTRYALLTGRYPWRSRLTRGVLDGTSRSLLGGERTIASVLRDHGYATACIGKWHLGLGAFDPAAPERPADFTAPFDVGPHTAGFDHSYIIPASLDMPPYVYVKDGAVVEPATARTPGSRPRRRGGEGFWRAGPMAPGFAFDAVVPTFTDRAVDWLEHALDDARPAFLYLPLPAPHTPWVPTPASRGVSGAGWYGDFVVEFDRAVGRILRTIDRHEARRNTVVILTSDNGAHWLPSDIERFGHRANGRWRGQKADIHEGGHRVPLIVRWPGVIEPGAQSDALVGLQDLPATLAEIAGAASEEFAGSDSISFRPALSGADGRRSTLVHQAFDGMLALRAGPWKLIEARGSGGFTAPRRVEPVDPTLGQLYHLPSDPAEADDRYALEPLRVAALQAMLARIQQTPGAAPPVEPEPVEPDPVEPDQVEPRAGDRSADDQTVFLLPYFLGNGEAGIALARSEDGIHFEHVRGGTPVLAAPTWPGAALTRDPSLLHHDGTFHLVWTTGWRGRSIGYASSTDLVTWSTPRRIEPWGDRTDVLNTWAPELHWDPDAREYVILWSSTTEAELTDDDGTDNPHGYDHRTYALRTTDFETFTEPVLFYRTDPERSVIDPVIAHDDRGTPSDPADDRWIMVIKDEMPRDRGGKNLRLVTSTTGLQGPFDRTLGPPIVGAGTSIVDTMGEGPTLLRHRDLWWLYWDAPGSAHAYCLATSPDLETWTDRSSELRMPIERMRHGTMVLVPRSATGALGADDS